MMRLSEFNRRLMEIRSVPEQMNALLDAVIEVTHAEKGFLILLRDAEPEVTVASEAEWRAMTTEEFAAHDALWADGGGCATAPALFRALVETLHEAVKHRGTTVDDHPFVDLYGKPGGYQDELKVYAREGEPCRRCRAPIVKGRYSNKPIYYCDACQV